VSHASQEPTSKSNSLASGRWRTVEEAALYLRCSEQHVRRLIHGAELRAVRFAKGYLLDQSDLDNLLLRRKRFFSPYRSGSKPWVARRHAQNRKGVSR
jgi:excisionase family DNA binding protein